ncbi:EAL domain-containing protein [Paenibacillus sp. GD4]|uniref:EAL domain-containing protein n=1 Tax=Paenibacillus sp. GD4 TaxID=3068890 RepID=UPI0027968169|nr:EAL domain-containing protein [Paenibacillus sp. GD4]MDQ1913665.1 EAL domain-containing protein [Paenibacillus sp. GD4]
MPLRRKIMLYILVTTLILFSVLYLISENTLLENYKKMESSTMHESMKQSLLAYYDEYTNLGAIAINYAGWDDTYSFINRTPIPTPNDPYLTVNYTDSLFTSSRLNVVLLMNSRKEVYFAKAYDYAGFRPLNYPSKFIDALLKDHSAFLEQPDSLARKQGLLVIDGQPIIAASYPILTSDNLGPVRGTLLFARFLDANYIQYIAQKSDMPLQIKVVDPSYRPPAEAVPVYLPGKRDALFWTETDEDVNRGFCLLTDFENRPALVLQFEKPRDLYKEAQRSINFYLVYYALSALLFFLIIIIVLQKTLFTRLQHTVIGMNRIKNHQDFSIRLQESGNDEMTMLERSFNHMMASLQQAQTEIHYQAWHDTLTGIPNRKAFYQCLEDYIHRNIPFAVLFVDLDRFKLINDTMGHRAGDLLLISTAERLQDCIDADDVLCRMGGDEFCIITFRNRKASKVEHLAQVIKETIGSPFELEGCRTMISASIGISLYPEHGDTAESLLHYSDTAMLDVKEAGKNNYRLYTESLDTVRTRRLKIEQHLKTAIDNKELSLHYQPKWNLQLDKMTGVEALLRWTNPELGAVSPYEFIPIIESSGLIHDIGEWIIRAACRQYAEWQSRNPDMSLLVAINISGIQLLEPGFVERLQLIFMEEKAVPHHFELEVTESFAIEKFDEIIDVFLRLRELGFTLSIDDFGAGYSSMKYVCQLPIHIMKIDKTLIDQLKDNPRNQVIISTLIEMAHQLDMTVVAEGVETVEQLELLKSYRCDQIQGYYISKPVPPNQIQEALAGCT